MKGLDSKSINNAVHIFTFVNKSLLRIKKPGRFSSTDTVDTSNSIFVILICAAFRTRSEAEWKRMNGIFRESQTRQQFTCMIFLHASGVESNRFSMHGTKEHYL